MVGVVSFNWLLVELAVVYLLAAVYDDDEEDEEEEDGCLYELDTVRSTKLSLLLVY